MSEDVASLLQAARERLKTRRTGPRWLRSDAVDLCDALEERECENEDLRRDLIDTNSQLTDALRGGETAQANVVGLEREVERLRDLLSNIVEVVERESVASEAGRVERHD